MCQSYVRLKCFVFVVSTMTYRDCYYKCLKILQRGHKSFFLPLNLFCLTRSTGLVLGEVLHKNLSYRTVEE